MASSASPGKASAWAGCGSNTGRCRRASLPWGLFDMGFVRLAAQYPRLPLALLRRVMCTIPLAQSLGFIDEQL